jgi:hypothetical protein
MRATLTLCLLVTSFGIGEAVAAPPIVWSPQVVPVSAYPGGVRRVTVDFVPTADTGPVRLSVVPALSSFVRVVPESLAGLRAGRSERVTLTVAPPAGARPGVVEGTVHVRSGASTLARPLAVKVTVTNAAPAAARLEEAVLASLGTLSPPPGPVADLPEAYPVDEAALQAVRQGSDDALVFKVGSLIWLGAMRDNPSLRSAVDTLMADLDERGLRTEGLRDAVGRTDYHREGRDVAGLTLEENVDGITINPYSGRITAYNGHIVVTDTRSHVVVAGSLADGLVPAPAIEPGILPTGYGLLLHETLHSMVFWSGCTAAPPGGSREEDTVGLLVAAVESRRLGAPGQLQSTVAAADALGASACVDLLGLRPGPPACVPLVVPDEGATGLPASVAVPWLTAFGLYTDPDPCYKIRFFTAFIRDSLVNDQPSFDFRLRCRDVFTGDFSGLDGEYTLLIPDVGIALAVPPSGARVQFSTGCPVDRALPFSIRDAQGQERLAGSFVYTSCCP